MDPWLVIQALKNGETVGDESVTSVAARGDHFEPTGRANAVKHQPGSPEKIEELRKRAELGQALFEDDDAASTPTIEEVSTHCVSAHVDPFNPSVRRAGGVEKGDE